MAKWSRTVARRRLGIARLFRCCSMGQSRSCQFAGAYEKAFERVYAAFHLAALSLLLIALVLQLNLWFPTGQAFAGALMIASLIQLALRQQEFDLSSIPPDAVFAPHSLLEPTFVALTCVLAQRGSHVWLTILVMAAALNSEASVILPALYLAVVGIRRSSVAMAGRYAVVWLIVTLGLRLVLGGVDGTLAIREVWHENLRHLPIAAVNVSLFLGPLWIAALFGLRRAPAPARRAAWLVLPISLRWRCGAIGRTCDYCLACIHCSRRSCWQRSSSPPMMVISRM